MFNENKTSSFAEQKQGEAGKRQHLLPNHISAQSQRNHIPSSMDRISDLPDNLIGLILEKLSVKDSVKTSALSRSWRLKWILVPSLILDQEFYDSLRCDDEREYAKVISSLTLQHDGCLKEFHLYITSYYQAVKPLFQDSIARATQNRSLEKLILDVANGFLLFDLPPGIFSAVNLSNLEIKGFQFLAPPGFEGLPNLTRFVLTMVITKSEWITHFVSVCPKLKEVAIETVHFIDENTDQYIDHGGDDKFIEPKPDPMTPKLESVSLCSCHKFGIARESPYILELLEKALQLQHVSLNSDYCKLLSSCSSIIERLPRYDQMRSLQFTLMDLNDPDQLRSVLSFCGRSPNIRKLHLHIREKIFRHKPEDFDVFEVESMVEKYINKDFNKLVRVDLFGFSGDNIEMKMIESLLHFSPVLEVLSIDFDSSVTEDVRLQSVKALTNFYQASSKSKINFTSAADHGSRVYCACARRPT